MVKIYKEWAGLPSRLVKIKISTQIELDHQDKTGELLHLPSQSWAARDIAESWHSGVKDTAKFD